MGGHKKGDKGREGGMGNKRVEREGERAEGELMGKSQKNRLVFLGVNSRTIYCTGLRASLCVTVPWVHYPSYAV